MHAGRRGEAGRTRRSAGIVPGRAGSNQDNLPHMADELLLTLVHRSMDEELRHDDPRVSDLVERLHRATGHRLRTIEKAPHGQGASHLTLRTRVEASPAQAVGHNPGGRAAPTARRDSHVVRAARLINSHIRTHGLELDGVQVSSAMPNWLVSAAVSVPPGGDGPATLPSPAPNGNGSWQFTLPEAGRASKQLGDREPDQRVVVAVLDTWPGLWRLEEASRRFPDNRLLERLAHGGVNLDASQLAPPDDVPERLTHASADHGLFVAGVITSIATHADLHLLHVLNENGHGRADLILEALDHCLTLAARRPVLVNLSLFLNIPNGASVGTLDDGIRWRVRRLLEAGAVIVAAAGNDSLGRSIPLPPRSPANYDGVLCVVATDRKGKRASYSNGPSENPLGSSVATFGGQAIMSGSRAVVPPGPDPRDGVVGVFAWPEVHPTGPNASGWVYWSGTSFATAVITGIAANVLESSQIAPDANRASQVSARIREMGNVDLDLKCPYVPVSQE